MFFRQLRLDSVNRAHRTMEGAAGKSINVAKVLKALGEAPLATGFLGGVRGKEVQQVLKSKGIVADFVSVAAPTRECITIINESNRTITELVQESGAVQATDYESLKNVIARHLPQCRALVMSGTLVDPDGSLQTLEISKQDPPNTLSAQARGLRPGVYRLRWQVLASDGHITRGEISFTVIKP